MGSLLIYTEKASRSYRFCPESQKEKLPCKIQHRDTKINSSQQFIKHIMSKRINAGLKFRK
jgi:hypothetical protein